MMVLYLIKVAVRLSDIRLSFKYFRDRNDFPRRRLILSNRSYVLLRSIQGKLGILSVTSKALSSQYLNRGKPVVFLIDLSSSGS